MRNWPRRVAEATGKHNAELQRLQAEKSGLAARLEGFGRDASTTLDNARQQERLAAEKELAEAASALDKADRRA